MVTLLSFLNVSSDDGWRDGKRGVIRLKMSKNRLSNSVASQMAGEKKP